MGVVCGGSFVCERLSGEVVSGNDWQSVCTDSCIRLEVQLVLKTTDGALIAMTYTCLRAGPLDVIERLDKGESVDPGSYYFHKIPIFKTLSSQNHSANFGTLNYRDGDLRHICQAERRRSFLSWLRALLTWPGVLRPFPVQDSREDRPRPGRPADQRRVSP